MSGRLALQDAAAVVRARVGAVVGLAGDVQALGLEHRAVLLGRVAERREEVAHHHAVDARADRERLQVGEVLHASAAEAEQRVREHEPEDRDPRDRLPRIQQPAVAELRPAPGDQQVHGHAGRVDLRELEGHLDALLGRLAEVQDAADARLQAGLPDGVDRPQPAVVADRGRDLRVVGLGGLDVVVHPLDARLLEHPRALRAEMADRDAALEVRLLRDQAHAVDDPAEVALGQPLAGSDHAEAVGAGRLGRARVLEHLLGLHHRVHRRLCLGEARLRAEAAVLGAAARLRAHQRAQIGAVPELLHAGGPGPLDQRLDVPGIGQRAELQGFLRGDQRGHDAVGPPGRRRDSWSVSAGPDGRPSGRHAAAPTRR